MGTSDYVITSGSKWVLDARFIVSGEWLSIPARAAEPGDEDRSDR